MFPMKIKQSDSNKHIFLKYNWGTSQCRPTESICTKAASTCPLFHSCPPYTQPTPRPFTAICANVQTNPGIWLPQQQSPASHSNQLQSRQRISLSSLPNHHPAYISTHEPGLIFVGELTLRIWCRPIPLASSLHPSSIYSLRTCSVFSVAPFYLELLMLRWPFLSQHTAHCA